MNIDLLIKMANEISAFFDGEESDPVRAQQAVAAHLIRFWAPPMRAQIVAYLEQRQGGGLSDTARAAVTLLARAPAAAAEARPE